MDEKTKTEKEIRFYFPANKFNLLKNKLKNIEFCESYYEMTKMYNNPNPKYDFYNPSIDGRLRLRYGISLENKTKSFGLVSWKQRIPKYSKELIRKEKEVEFTFDIKDIDNVKNIIENILRCPLVSSYERRRHYYSTSNFSITLDEFPFGLMLEIEFKKNNINNTDINDLLKLFNLRIEDASFLSCDDMYKNLCLKNNKKNKPDILFSDKDMPRL
jgi:adenylate cyclase class IV